MMGSKFEIPNPKQIQTLKFKCSKQDQICYVCDSLVSNFRLFEFRSLNSSAQSRMTQDSGCEALR